MTEHEHSHHPEHHHAHKHEENYILPGSILLAGILVAVSIFYSNNMLIKKLGGSGSQLLGQQNEATKQQALGDSAPGAAAEIPERQELNLLGSEKTKVKLVEYSDFQCPFCQKFFNDTYGALKSKYVDTGKVSFDYRHFPLPSHQNAQKSAEASECAADQGKFFVYHDVLFENMQSDGTGLNNTDLKQYAKDLGLNTSRFNQCLDNGEKTDIVKADLSAGQSLGVNGTPTLFVNGKMIVGAQAVSVFEAAIEAALNE